tara:strand:+ start:7380 stop:7970 length:591 start_codon:yes stop_codon:yes gene_type:complete
MSNYEATKYNFTGANIQGIAGINTGIIVPWSKDAVPSGFLLCDGSNVSRSTYADLFAVVATTYGSGDGSSTFGLPDLQNNCVVGRSNNKALAATGGAETVAASGNLSVTAELSNASLTEAQLPNHTHTGGSVYGGGGGTYRSGDRGPYSANYAGSMASAGSGSAHAHNLTLNTETFSGTASSVLQPYIAILYIIKT